MRTGRILALASLSLASAALAFACVDDSTDTPSGLAVDGGSLPDGSQSSDASTSRQDAEGVDVSQPDVSQPDAGPTDLDAPADVATDAVSDAGADAPVEAATEAGPDAAAATGGPYLYFPTNVDNTILGYKLGGPDGGLAPIDMDPGTAGVQKLTVNRPSTVAAHPSGKWLFNAAFGGSNIGAYAIDPATGVLTQRDVDVATPGVQDFTLGAGYSGGYIAADPKGRVLYFSDSNGNRLVTLSVDGATGALSVVSTVTLGISVRAFAVDPKAGFLYMVSDAINPGVVRIPLDPSTGIPTTGPLADGGFASLTLSGAGNCVEAVVSADGQLYTSCSQNQKIHAVGESADGGLTSLGSATVGVAPLAVTTHPNGKFAYSATFSAADLHTYAIAPDAGPTAVGSALTISASCRSFVFEPTANVLFAGCDGKIVALLIDAVTGAPTLLGSVLAGTDSGYSMAIVTPPL